MLNLQLVHLQLTRNCNLRCSFCGQWGKKGFFSDAAGKPVSLEQWKMLARSLKAQCNPLPDLLLWGGEPLLYPYFEELVKELHSLGFRLGMVTNGTLLQRYGEICKRYFRVIYISLDGPMEVHESIRGKGTFSDTVAGIEAIRGGNAKSIVMSVLTPALLDCLSEYPMLLATHGVDMLYLQDYILLSKEEADRYRAWLSRYFQVQAEGIDAWVGTMPPDYAEKKKRVIAALFQQKQPIPIQYLAHTTEGVCCSAEKHIHVAWNGDVLYCTDFYDFSAGNIHTEDVLSIFHNERSELFRRVVGENPACAHCSWRRSSQFFLLP